MSTESFENNKEQALNQENSNTYQSEYDKMLFSSDNSNKRYQRKASFKKVLANIVGVLIIITLISVKYVIPNIINRPPEIIDCLVHDTSSNSGYDYNKVQQSLNANGYDSTYYNKNDDVTIQYSSKQVGDTLVDFHYQNADTRGFCTISIKKSFEVEIDGEVLHFSVEVSSDDEDINVYSIRYKLGENMYIDNELYNTNVHKDFSEDDIIFFQEFDNEIINEYYNYQYPREMVDILMVEVESFMKGD